MSLHPLPPYKPKVPVRFGFDETYPGNDSSDVVLASYITKIVESSILSFCQFIKKDKKNSQMVLVSYLDIKVTLPHRFNKSSLRLRSASSFNSSTFNCRGSLKMNFLKQIQARDICSVKKIIAHPFQHSKNPRILKLHMWLKSASHEKHSLPILNVDTRFS